MNLTTNDLENFRIAAKDLTPEQAARILRKVIGVPRRELKGKEYNDVFLLIQLADAVRVSNNQRTITYEYDIGGKFYYVTYGDDDHPMIEEREEDDIQQG